MILVDELGEIDLQFGMGKNLQPFEGSFDLSQLQYQYLDHHDIAEHILYIPYQQQANQVLSLDFLEALLSAWIFWESNQKNQYFQELFELILSDEFIILSWPEGEALPGISEDFFNFYQQLYTQKLQQHQMRGFIPKIALHTGKHISIAAQQKFIQKINYSEIEIEKAIAEIQKIKK